MPQVWQQDTEETWTLRDNEGGILAAVTREDDATFRAIGPLLDEPEDFPSLEEAQVAVDRRRNEELGT